MTDALSPKPSAGRALFSAAAFVIVVAGLRSAAGILQPLLLAVFLAALSFPLLDWLRRLGVRTPLAIVTTVLADIGLLIALGFLISGAVNQFAATAPEYVSALTERTRTAIAALEERGVTISEWVALEPVDSRQLLDVVGGIAGTVWGVLTAVSNLTLVAVTLIFVLYELIVWPDKLERAFGEPGPRQRFEDVFGELQRYLGVKTAVSIATGLLVGTWVWALGVDFPLLWGLAAFLLNYVPVLGPFIAAVPATVVALVQHGWARALFLGLGYLAIRLVIGDLIEPRLMGRRFGLSTTVVLVSLVFWAWIWGALGAILSVPLTMTLKIALEHSRELSWLAGLMGRGPVRAPP